MVDPIRPDRPTMTIATRRGLQLGLAAGAVVAAALAAALAGAPRGAAAPRADEGRSFARLPWAGRGAAGPYRSLPTAAVSPTTGPSATAGPPTATPTPTPDPRRVDAPTAAGEIVLQIGRTDAEDQGIAWDEMSGTPYLTVYGDGHVIAFRRLFSYDQTLYETRVDTATVQAWLVPLVHDIDVGTLPARTNHPVESRFAAHLYVRHGPAAGDWTRVSVGGLMYWLEGELPDLPDAARIRRLAAFVAGLEPFTRALDAPYAPTEYTIISHEMAGTVAPNWPLRLNVKKISDAAPIRTGEGYIHGPPGHLVANAATAQPVRDLTVRDARERFPAHAFVATYRTAGSPNLFAVGARPEVPGGSRWLPERTYDRWYRKDDITP